MNTVRHFVQEVLLYQDDFDGVEDVDLEVGPFGMDSHCNYWAVEEEEKCFCCAVL